MIFLSPFQSYEHICQTPPMNFTKNFCILCNVNYLRGRNDNRNDSVEKQIYLSFGSKANSLQERYKLFSFCLGRDKGISHLNPSYSTSTVKCCHILIIFFFFFFLWDLVILGSLCHTSWDFHFNCACLSVLLPQFVFSFNNNNPKKIIFSAKFYVK